MADGTISIKIEVDGKEVSVASKELDKLEESGYKLGKGIDSAEKSLDSLGDSSAKASKDLKGTDGAIDDLADSSADASKSVKGTSDSLDDVGDSASDAAKQTKMMKDETEDMGDKSDQSSGKVKKFATSIGLIAIAAGAFKVLKSAMDDAISRFDTLNKFPKVLQALGVSAEDSEKAMNDLSDGIDGLPTKLDDIAASAQEIYPSFNDIDKATDTALALNNALLGSGASAEQAKRGTQQYSKALQTDQMYLSTWNTLSETMGIGLIKVAEGFGYAGASAKNDLYQALQDGTITMDQFNDKLIEVGTGTGIMAELAKENSLGIATSFGNLRYAVARGIANVIESFDKLSKKVTGKDIAENIDGMKDVVMVAFGAIQNIIEGTTPIVMFFTDGIKATIPVVDALTPAIIGLMTAYGAYVVITKASAAISASNKVLATAIASQKTLTLVKNIDTAATAKNTGALTLNNVIIGVLTGKMKLSTAAMIAKTAAANLLGGALKFLSGPVGWVVAGIGALVTATVAVVKWFKRSTAEGKRLKEETEELSNSTDALNDSVKESSEAYQNSQKEIESSAKANEELAKKVEDLADKENKSAAEKAMLASYVDQLNESVEGLNLSYSEEADALSMSSEELQARVDLMKEEEAGMAAKERMLEIAKEQNEVEMKLDEINELREESIRLEEEGAIKKSEHKEAVEELDEKEQELKETLAELGEQQVITEEQFTTSMENITAAIEEGNLRQITSYEDLEDAQKEAFDSMKATYDELADNATNAFDRMNDESKVTAEEMIENLEHNQEMTRQWGENIAELYNRAGKNSIDDGFVKYLEGLGPSAAAEVQEVANMSEAELKKYSELMAEGGNVATDSLKTALGEGFEDAVDVMVNFIDDGSKSMRDQIKDSGFDEIGSMVPEGLIEGIEGGIPDTEKASEEMATAVIGATQKALDTHSPSRVFEGIGGDTTDGMVLGITNGTKAVIDSMKKLLASSIKEFNTIKTDYSSIGKDAMDGFHAGLVSGRGKVLATARSIANSVASTMRQALQTRSPSKITESIGEDTGDGFVGGLLSRVGIVERASRSLAQSATPMMMSTPEMALGTSRMAYSGSGAMSNVTNSTTRNEHNSVDMNGLFNGANFHIRDDHDIPKLAKELNDYSRSVARSKGVHMP